jgi:hypothetical protein
MQTTIVLPDPSLIADRRKPVKRPMTYQVIFCGIDGVVVASDRSEGQPHPDGSIAIGNEITKLRIRDEFAWMFSGGDWAKIFADHLDEHLDKNKEDAPNMNDAQLRNLFETCQRSVVEQWGTRLSPDRTSKVLFVRGSDRTLFSINPVPHTLPDRLVVGRAIAGDITNAASFLFRRIHSSEMSVKALQSLAAYSVQVAHFFNSAGISGLDMATYIDPRESDDNSSKPAFRLVDAKPYLGCEEKIEEEFRGLLERFSFGQ